MQTFYLTQDHSVSIGNGWARNRITTDSSHAFNSCDEYGATKWFPRNETESEWFILDEDVKPNWKGKTRYSTDEGRTEGLVYLK